MHSFVAKPAKILVCFMGRRRGELLVTAAKTGGARGGTLALGKSLADSKVLQALSLADAQQDIVFIVMGNESEGVVAGIRRAAEENPKKLRGMAVLLDVAELFTRLNPGKPSGRYPAAREQAQRSDKMESGYTMINVIVNSGYADDVMAVARKAGATGGSIISARGTGTEDDVKFFGITLVPEKEMLLIISEQSKVKPIVDAIATVPTLNEPGGGIIFNLNVEEFIVMGKG